MGMLATCYTDDKDRSHAFSVALSGLAIGVLGRFTDLLENYLCFDSPIKNILKS